MNLIKKVNYILTSKQKIRLIELTFIIIIGAVLELIGVAIIMPLITIVTDTTVIKSAPLFLKLYTFCQMPSDREFIAMLFIGVAVVYVIKNIYIVFMNYLLARFTGNNQRYLARKLLEGYMRQTYLFHISQNISELQRNVDTDTRMFFSVLQAFLQFLAEAGVCVLLVTFLFIKEPAMTAGLAVVLLFFTLLFLRAFKHKIYILGEETREYDSGARKWLRQSFEGIKEIKILNREDFFIDEFDERYAGYAKANSAFTALNSAPRPIFEAICVVAMLSVVAVQIVNGVELNSFISTLSAFVMATFRLLPSFGRLTNYINTMTFNKSAVDSAYHDLKEVETMQMNTSLLAEKKIIPTISNEIKIDNLCFNYPATDKMVLDGVSLSIKKGQAVAFVGASGAGKSTLADIILGVLKPKAGAVYVDERDIYSENYIWGDKIGYIPQMIYLIDDSIRNNILFGLSSADESDDAIWDALKNAQMEEYVRSLPEGINTVIGERGIRLSGGQRQRIGIARALYRNPEVVVLDEATSALDSETERAVMGAIDALQGQKTLIIIAHRLTTIRNCDCVYEISDGHVIKKEVNEILMRDKM